jgi:hypothetical protein
MPILWRYITSSYEYPYDYDIESHLKFYITIASFIPKDPLRQNNIVLPLHKFKRILQFEYMGIFYSYYTILDQRHGRSFN